MPIATRADVGVLLIAVAGLVLLGIGMFDGDLVELAMPISEVPEGGTLAERAEAITGLLDDVDAVIGSDPANPLSTLGKGLVVLPLLAGGFALHRIVRRGRGIPSWSIAQLAIVTSVVAAAALLVRTSVDADSGGLLAALSRALGADRGLDVALTAGGWITVASLALMFAAGLLILGSPGRGGPGNAFGRQDR